MIPPSPPPPPPGDLRETLFPPTSRHHANEILKTELPSGREVSYVERRFLPPHEMLQVVDEHIVGELDRIDNIAAHYFGNGELFWRVCDGNYKLDPREAASVVMRRLNITTPPQQVGINDG